MGIFEALGPFGRLLAFAVGLDDEEGGADGISDGAGVDGETDGMSEGRAIGDSDGVSDGAEVDGGADGTSLEDSDGAIDGTSVSLPPPTNL